MTHGWRTVAHGDARCKTHRRKAIRRSGEVRAVWRSQEIWTWMTTSLLLFKVEMGYKEMVCAMMVMQATWIHREMEARPETARMLKRNSD